MFKNIIEFFQSIKATIWLLCFLTGLLLAGAFIMPVRIEFESIHSIPLFDWLTKQPIAAVWWLWGAIAILILLTANTIFCSIESLIKKRKTTQWLLLISPQIIHIGFLFILLAHLFSSAGGFKGAAVAVEETSIIMPDSTTLLVKGINLNIDQRGFLRSWAVDIQYKSGSLLLQEDKILPNKPSIREGTGVYVKDLQAYPYKAILLEISKEPGAIWALIGGVVFTIGTVILVILKIRQSPDK